MDPIRITNPADLVAAVPAMLGYVPSERVVLIAVADRRLIAAGSFSVSVLDTPDQFGEIVHKMAAKTEATAFISVLVTEDSALWISATALIKETAAQAGVDMADMMHAPRIAEGEQVFALSRSDMATMPEPSATAMATAMAVESGQVTGRSREEIAAMHQPDEKAAERRADLDNVEARTTTEAVRETIAAALDGRTDDDAVIRAAAAWTDVNARDIAIGLATGSQGEQITDWMITVARKVGTIDAYGVAAVAAYAINRTVIAGILVEHGQATGQVNNLLALVSDLIDEVIEPTKVRTRLDEAARMVAAEYGITLPE